MKHLESIVLTTGSTLVFTFIIGLWAHAGPALLGAYVVLLVALPPLLALGLYGGQRLFPGSAAGRWLAAGVLCQVALLLLIWLFKPGTAGFFAFLLTLFRPVWVAAFVLLPFWLGLLTAGWWLGFFQTNKLRAPPTRPRRA